MKTQSNAVSGLVRCEKVGPMEWLIYAPSKAPFKYWTYVLEHNGVSYTETFEVLL
jgi:hypothetical protein